MKYIFIEEIDPYEEYDETIKCNWDLVSVHWRDAYDAEKWTVIKITNQQIQLLSQSGGFGTV
jgi:hypothetical protein